MKNYKKFISIICFTLIFCIITPSYSYAATSSNVEFNIDLYFEKEDRLYSAERSELPISVISKNYPQSSLSTIDIKYHPSMKLKENDVLTFTLHTQFKRYLDMDVSYGLNNGNTYFKTGQGTYNSDGTITFTTSVSDDCDNFFIDIYLTNLKVSSNSIILDAGFGIDSFSCKTESQQTGFFNKVSDFFSDLFSKLKAWFDSLFQWLKDIRDKISSGFSDLVNNIKNFFTNLTNNLKSWFESVGQWFKDIGDKIGGFFSDLWNNITIRIDGTIEDIRNWWQSVVDWFHNLFVPDDGYFDEYRTKWDNWFKIHFGFIYEAVNMIDEIIITLSNSFKGSDDMDFEVVIPQIRLPYTFGRLRPIIYEGGTFSFSELTSGTETLFTIMDVCTSAIFYFALIMYGKKSLEEIIADREL